jgi:hypothetical protein
MLRNSEKVWRRSVLDAKAILPDVAIGDAVEVLPYCPISPNGVSIVRPWYSSVGEPEADDLKDAVSIASAYGPW